MTLTHAHPALAPNGAGRFAARPAARHLLGLEAMDRDDLLRILDEAERWREAMDAREPDSRELAGITVCLGFFEASTRTRVSFELAATRLGARVVTFSVGESSTAKGETLLDTVRVLEAMRVDLFVVRHPASGAPGYIADHLHAGVINAGDGQHEHPTQGLLDLLTLRRVWKGRFEGRRIVLVGDIAHSRVARSAIHGLRTLGAHVTVAGPPTLVPAGIEALGVTVAPALEPALEGVDAVMALRLQRERMEQGLLASTGEYAREWGIDAKRVRLLHEDGVVLHPGPVNRGVELSPDVVDGQRSVIFDQVTNGVAVRCAVLARCARALSEAA